MIPTLPTVADELDSRSAKVARLRAFLKAHPYDELDAEALQQIVGPNYQQRVSDCKHLCDVPDCPHVGCDYRDHDGCHAGHGMAIQNIPRYYVDDTGRKRHGIGAYLYRPQAPQGRAADSPRTQQTLWGY